MPFGADVLDVLGNPVGMVGQAGQAFARVEATDGTLRVRWDGGRAADCSFHYRVDAAPDGQMPRIEAICVPGEGDSAGG